MALNQDKLLRLLMSHRGMLLGYITSITGDPHLAEDVLQDSSLIILKKGSQLEGEAGFAPWARRIARLEALNARRKSDRLPSVLTEGTLDKLESAWDQNETDETLREQLRTCMQKLTPNARSIVELRYHQGVTGKALADRLKRPLNTVYVALTRIHKTLADCVRAGMGEQARG